MNRLPLERTAALPSVLMPMIKALSEVSGRKNSTLRSLVISKLVIEVIEAA
jgi:hypothetical protein